MIKDILRIIELQVKLTMHKIFYKTFLVSYAFQTEVGLGMGSSAISAKNKKDAIFIALEINDLPDFKDTEKIILNVERL